MDFRLVSILLVFVCSMVGSVGAHILSKHQLSRHPWMKSLLKMFSAGMMMSLALVHITSEVILELHEHIHFPLGACTILIGLLVMMIADHAAQSIQSKQSHGDTPDVETPLSECSRCVYHCQDVEHTSTSSSYHEHAHACISTLTPATLVSAAAKDTADANKNTLSVWMLEIACVFHSFLIGLSLGVSSQDEPNGGKAFHPLTIALSFHQLLEGVSVGSSTCDYKMSNVKVLSLVVLYSITAPLGIATGMFIDNALVTDKSQVITLSFQGFAGGMLLYVAMFQMIAEEFSKKATHEHLNRYQKIMMYGALVSGASSMCIMALWL